MHTLDSFRLAVLAAVVRRSFLTLYDAPLRKARVYHLGIFREKVSLQPVECTSTLLFRLHRPAHTSTPNRLLETSTQPYS